MTSERWQKIETIFYAALDYSGAGREEFLRRECADNTELLAEVRKLIASHETEDEFLESPVWTDSLIFQPSLRHQIAGSLEDEIQSEACAEKESIIGRRIGVYRLTAELGRGGMGVVYAAERADGEFQQKVAIKLIKRGMDTDFIVRRFRRERQIAAALNHPNIARLFDGGTTQDGLPYFVMELIDGAPFFKYAETENLNLSEKLKLFLSVCQAVVHAHEQQIVHRDIKPGNILVTTGGIPKLLDFGIAKILDHDSIHEAVLPTQTQMRLMTPEYASPEQVKGDEITTASDQYSLGVLLYELITGKRPYQFPSRSPLEIARIICEENPTALLSPEAANKIADRESANDSAREISEDLQKIVLKSLRKNPAERYESVNEFARDITRFLSGEAAPRESFAGGETTLANAATLKTSESITEAYQKSIAVLPFKILNSAAEAKTGDEEFLGVGLADALITRLSNVRQFLVRPTGSILIYAERSADSFGAGRDLNVRYILDGSIIKTAARVRVSVQLLDVAEQITVWAERFDEDLTDVLNLEDSISKRAVESLVPQLSLGERKQLAKRGTDDAAAYEDYLRGRFYWNSFTEESFAKAFVHYTKAIAHDPDYALAYAGIADYYIWLGVYGVLPPQDCYPPAKDAARRAVELDDELADAYAALGLAQLCGDYDWAEAEKSIVRAIELNPNHTVARLWYSYVLQSAGRYESGIEQARRAVKLDPLTYTNYHVLAWAHYFARDFTQAATQAAANIEKFPGIGLAYFTQSWVLRLTGGHTEALEASRRAVELSGDSLFVLLGHAQALAAAKKKPETAETLQRIFELGTRQYLSYYQVALVYVYAGEIEKALGALETAFENREGWLIWLATEPAFDPLRGEPEFIDLRERIDGFASHQAHDAAAPPEQSSGGENILAASASAPAAEIVPATASKNKSKLPTWFKLAVGAVIAAVIGYAAYHLVFSPKYDLSGLPSEQNWEINFAATMRLERLTVSGKNRLAAISPNGERIAFVAEKDETETLLIRQTDSENAVPLVAPAAVFFVGLQFSPNGEDIYYTTINRSYTERILWRVASDGGENAAPQKVLENVNSRVGIAPDGRRITYFGYDADTKLASLFVAELNAGGGLQSLKTIATRLQPDYFLGNPAFSPDGKRIAFPVAVVADQTETVNLFVINLATGAEEKLVARDFNDIVAVDWRANGDEIVINANEKNTDPLQLWLVSASTGEISRLTNDLTNYYGVSLTRNSDALVTVQRTTVSNVATVNPDAGKIINSIADGVNRQDGIEGVGWTFDNRILYISSVAGKNSIVLANADGTNSRVIDLGDALPSNPLLTRNGRYLFFVDEKAQQSKLRRYEMATGTLADVTAQFVMTPALTTDDKFVVYTIFNRERKTTLHRIPVEGGAEVELTSVRTVSPAVSPNNKFIAAYFNDDKGEGWRIGIFPISGGAPVKIIAPPETINLQSPLDRALAWSADSRWIYYQNDRGGTSNIFRIAVDDTGKIEQMTRFSSGQIFDFALAPDDQSLIFARGAISSDVVIFKTTR